MKMNSKDKITPKNLSGDTTLKFSGRCKRRASLLFLKLFLLPQRPSFHCRHNQALRDIYSRSIPIRIISRNGKYQFNVNVNVNFMFETFFFPGSLWLEKILGCQVLKNDEKILQQNRQLSSFFPATT